MTPSAPSIPSFNEILNNIDDCLATTHEQECKACSETFAMSEGETNDYCFSCSRKLEISSRNKEKAIALLKSVTPPLFLQTDPRHARFNSSAWSAIRSHKPTQEKPWIGLVGSPGSCKTRIAFLLLGRFVSDLAKQQFCNPISMSTVSSYRFGEVVMDQFSSSFEEKSKARNILMDFRRSQILLIDDIGKGKLTPAVAAELFALIDHRYVGQLTTIWTSNTPPEEIARNLPDDMKGAFAGRLVESSKVFNFR